MAGERGITRGDLLKARSRRGPRAPARRPRGRRRGRGDPTAAAAALPRPVRSRG